MAGTTAGRAGKSMLRIGCVKYLNARPLIRGWKGDVDFDHPSALCNKLAARKVDVALVSSFEFLRNPIYWIVDDVSISSAGPVYSVVLAHHGDITKIEEIDLDPASETSVNLLRCLLAELGLNPRLRSSGCQSAVIGSPATPHTARLLIGDQAVYFRQEHPSGFHFWDLGERWKELVGIPFVYALWLIRPEIAEPKQIANRLRALRDENLARLDDLIAELAARVADQGRQEKLNRGFFLRYYREHLRFGFGKNEKEGLRIFANLCIKHGLLPKHDLAFRVV